MTCHPCRSVFVLVFMVACGDVPQTGADREADLQGLLAGEHVTVAVLGDYGTNSPAEHKVAKLIHGWQPDFIVTTGDNNYPDGSETNLDTNIGQFFHRYIRFGAASRSRYRKQSADMQAFFPTLGNHDWLSDHARPYLRYFDLPGNKRYYQVRRGAIEFFMLDSDTREPDGVTVQSKQAQWLKSALAASEARWKIVAFHHPPYSTGWHGGTAYMRWPFKAWGAHAVLTGHDHHYERIVKGGLPYLVVGTGGADLRAAWGRHPKCEVDVVATWRHGALRIEADAQDLAVGFYDTANRYVDGFSLPERTQENTALPEVNANRL